MTYGVRDMSRVCDSVLRYVVVALSMSSEVSQSFMSANRALPIHGRRQPYRARTASPARKW